MRKFDARLDAAMGFFDSNKSSLDDRIVELEHKLDKEFISKGKNIPSGDARAVELKKLRAERKNAK